MAEGPDQLRPYNVALSDEAIDWIVRLGSGTINDADHATFEQWQARSPAHAAALQEAADLLTDIGSTQAAFTHKAAYGTPSASSPIGADIASVGFTPDQIAAPSAGAPISPSPFAAVPMPTRIGRRAMLTGGIGTALAASLIIGGYFAPVSWMLADERTNIGERRKIALPDGSTVWLNSGTAPSHDFTPQERRLTLHSGEALFDVAKDPARPFIVTAGEGEARAIGTVYSVRRRNAANEVIVSEGVVEVRHGQEKAQLIAGQRLAYGDNILGHVRTADADAATAWTRGKLIFNHMPLADVAAEAQRYQRSRIIIIGDTLRRTEVTGLFELDDPDALLRAISTATKAKIMRLPMLTIIR